MKQNIRTLLLFISISVLVASCSLDTFNEATLSPEAALSDSTGFRALVFSTYERINDFNFYGQQAMMEPEVMADNMILVSNTRYTGQIVNANASHMARWGTDPGGTGVTLGTGRYVAINEANTVLAKVDNLAAPQNIKNRYKGEAYFVRALNYFELLRVYSYEPGREVAGFNLGVVLRTKPITETGDIELLGRSTNEEGYVLMESDLKQAITLLQNPSSSSNVSAPFRATKQAAHALLAKVYLYWGKYALAAQQADLALAFSFAPLTTTANYLASWAQTPHPESIFESPIVPADWSSVDGANNSLHSMTMNLLSSAQYAVAASAELIAAHETGDIRLSLYENNASTQARNRSRKWTGGNPSNAFMENIPIIRRAEAVLISAEGKARSGDEVGALTMLNTLRTARGLSSVAVTGTALTDRILNERRVELAFEGNRWFDLKRLGRDITKAAGTGGTTVPYTDFRILSNIPPDQITISPKILQNPGY
jgi:starch-binding outer membrane protein, SusD/RagB family